MSGHDPGAVASRAEKLGISGFLEKPFSREKLCSAVKKVFGSPPADAASDPKDPNPPCGRPRFEQSKQKEPNNSQRPLDFCGPTPAAK
jgi:DNA-binding NtrC family response regulator